MASDVAVGSVTVPPSHCVYMLGLVMLELVSGSFGMFAAVKSYTKARSLIRERLWEVKNPAHRELLG